MITAIDSSVLHAIANGEPTASSWLETIADAREEGPLVICDVVYAELAAAFSFQEELERLLFALGVGLDPIKAEAAFLAGRTFRAYRDAKGPRSHLIPDFLIGAHAEVQADRLATLDSGFLRVYFIQLERLTIST
jgi:predicted nucleic acid-binding protein